VISDVVGREMGPWLWFVREVVMVGGIGGAVGGFNGGSILGFIRNRGSSMEVRSSLMQSTLFLAISRASASGGGTVMSSRVWDVRANRSA